MNREQAKDYINRQEPTFLPKASKRGYICPFCDQGKTEGQGITRESGKPHLWYCVDCQIGRSVTGLWAGHVHIEDTPKNFPEIIDGAAQYYGIIIDDAEAPRKPVEKRKPQEARTHTQQQAPRAESTDVDAEAEPDYTSYLREVSKNITTAAAQEYLSFRGISTETAQRLNLGFDPAWRHPKRPKMKPSPRLIVPTSKHSYLARHASRSDYINERGEVENKSKAGKVHFDMRGIYNEAGRACFVTEGELDAVAVIEAGGEAVGLGSKNYVKKFLAKLAEKPTRTTLILCLDADAAGQKAELELAEGLDALNISHVTADICGGHKDPNEALQADRSAFERAITEAESRTRKPDAVTDYINRLMGDDIKTLQRWTGRKTGFANLDTELMGIYPGLYVLGAISSLGKTTFIHQIADQMAAAGEDVIFFSLEQSRLEMVSKSIARMTAKRDITTASTSLAIRSGAAFQSRPGDRQQQQRQRAALDAAQAYTAAVGDRLSVIEGNFNCTVSFIGEYTQQYMERNPGTKPIVVVDYLQITQGDQAQRQSAKEQVDGNITALKRISRNLDVPVFLISSLNRQNYAQPVDFESFKESGGIEYSADVLLGLQLAIMNDDLFNQEKKIKEKRERVRAAKAENPRKIELVCLKNRYGRSSFKNPVLFDYYPEYDLFLEGQTT